MGSILWKSLEQNERLNLTPKIDDLPYPNPNARLIYPQLEPWNIMFVP